MATSTGAFPTTSGSLGELEDIIKLALKRTGASKELDLCAYLSDERGSLSPSTYLRLKDTDRATLRNLIKERVLETDLHRLLHKAQGVPSYSPYAGQALEECIKEAMVKVNVSRETALCKYIPVDEGYMHHFTFLKMKSANPVQLRNIIKEHILDRAPRLIPPRKRHRRQQREFSERASLSQSQDKTPRIDVVEPEYAHTSAYKESSQETSGRKFVRTDEKNIESPRGTENSKFDSLLDELSRLVRVLQHKEYDLKFPEEGRSHRVAPSSYASEKYLQVIQHQLISKIKRGQADEELWNMFVELI